MDIIDLIELLGLQDHTCKEFGVILTYKQNDNQVAFSQNENSVTVGIYEIAKIPVYFHIFGTTPISYIVKLRQAIYDVIAPF